MPRPSRCRRVCCEPDIRGFAPDKCCVADPVVLLVEEYECVRLIDLKKRTHDQCARQMQISRTTVTEIYEKARFKIADALINGKRLVIDGGNYRVCQESDCCGCAGRCPRRSPARSAPFGQQGVFPMKVAVPFKNDNIFAHFGMAPAFKVYTVHQDGIAASELVPAGGHGHGAMVNLLVKNGVDTVICGGLGGGAVSALAQAGITLYAGNEGPADEAVRCLIAGRLTNNLEAATATTKPRTAVAAKKTNPSTKATATGMGTVTAATVTAAATECQFRRGGDCYSRLPDIPSKPPGCSAIGRFFV